MKKNQKYNSNLKFSNNRRGFEHVEAIDRIMRTDELISELRKSINTNYDKEKELYKKEKKLTTV